MQIDDNLYEKLIENVGRHNIGSNMERDWDESILKLLDAKPDIKIDSLRVCDFPNCSPANPKPEFLDVLGVLSGSSTATLKKAFMECNAYRWLKSVLEQKESNEIYYGGLTSLIHDAIETDSGLGRKKIKELQTSLLDWIKELDVEEIQIDRPNYSERIRLLQ